MIIRLCCGEPVGIKMDLLYVVLFAALFATGLAEIANIESCAESSDDICKVTEVRITPCQKNKKCVFVKGSDATMSFDFTPNFAANELETSVYWANGAVDINFEGFGSNDGCAYTTCPTEAGKSQTLNYNLHVSKKLPPGSFTFKWKVWDKEDIAKLCCFKTTITLKK